MTDLPQSRVDHPADAGSFVAGAGPIRMLSRWAQLLPTGAWARIALLFVYLVLVKVVLLISLSKHLYEMHWRVVGEPESWVNYVAFFAFIGLGTAGLLSLANEARKKGLTAVRTMNAAVVGLGLLFIFLTFHTGDKNYLYPILTKTLTWGSLIPYLSLDLCFRPPFLAAWLLGYAFVYYVMARTGREIRALHLTVLVAAAYGLICLRELRYFPYELLVIDAVGLACAWASFTFPSVKASKQYPRVLWAFTPSIWIVFYLALLRLAAPELRHIDPYFLLLLGGMVCLFAAASLLAIRRELAGAWGLFAPFFFTAFLLLANAYYPMAHNYNNSLCVGFELPHYFLGELALAVTVAAGAALYHRVLPKAGFRWLDIANIVFIAIAVIDLRLSQVMGVRLGWDVLTFGDSPKMMWRMARPYLPGVVIGVLAIVLLYTFSLRAIRSWLCARPKKPPTVGGSQSAPLRQVQLGLWFASPAPWFASPAPWFAILSFVLLGILGRTTAEPDKAQGESALRLAASSPLWVRISSRTLSPRDLLDRADQLGLGLTPSVDELPVSSKPSDLNLLVVFMESSYNKYLSLFGSEYETQPLLSKYKDRMEVFPNFFSDFASSIHARFATFTSLYPVRDYNAFTLHPVKVKSLFEALHDHGYSCSMFYSSFFDYTGFGDFLKGRGFEEMYDANNMPGASAAEKVSWGLKEETTLAAMRDQIKAYAQNKRRFFLTYVPAAPHYPYDSIPERFRKFKKEGMNDYTPVYLNELLYMDWVLASIVHQLQDSGLLDHTLVMITNDHGEMLGSEGGPIGHGWAFTPELGNTPLILMDPRNPGWRVNYTIGSQVDFLPSVLDLLNLPLPAGELYEGRSMYRPDARTNRRIYLNTCQQFGILEGDRITVGDRSGAPSTKTNTFTLSNQGTKTIFRESGIAASPISIQSFDEFQENLLRNYSLYRQSVCKKNNLAVHSVENAPTLVRASRQ